MFRKRKGFSAVEQLVLLVVIALLVSIAVRSGVRLFDRAAARAAARDVTDALAHARDYATAQGTRTAVRIAAAESKLVVHAVSDTIRRFDLRERHHVTIESTRDSMAYAPTGLGWGASNMRIVVKRGAAAESVTVSRLGRVKGPG